MRRIGAAMLVIVVGLGCDDAANGHEHGTEHDHGHGHGHGDEVAVSVTRWTDRVELYAEHPPAVVDGTVGFLAHVTVLDGFRPLTEGRVVLVLEGPQTIRAEGEEPLRPGIFYPRFIPRTAGTYDARLEIHAPGIDDTVEGFSVEVYGSDEAADEAHPGGADDGRSVSFLKEQQWRVGFDTAPVTRRTIVPTVEVAGEVTTPPGGRAEVGAPMAGRIVAPPDGLPQPGAEVSEGDLLLTIAPAPSSPEGGARATLAVAEAEARLARAESDLARAERLVRDQAISERQHEQTRREVEVAREALRAARRAQGMFGGGGRTGSWRVTSPIDGVVAQVDASPGGAATPDDTLFRIVDPSELWIHARVPEQDAARLRDDADASYRPTGADAWGTIDVTGDDATAAVVSVGRTVDPHSRTVDVIYRLEEPDDRLRVGGLVRVAVPVGDPLEAVALPRSAILDDAGRSIVYIQVEGEAFEERTVRSGARSGGWVAVTEGVEPGERIVTEGANLIRLASRAPEGAGHGHVH